MVEGLTLAVVVTYVLSKGGMLVLVGMAKCFLGAFIYFLRHQCCCLKACEAPDLVAISGHALLMTLLKTWWVGNMNLCLCEENF